MSKSTLSITVQTPAYPSSSHMTSRTIEVPCRLPDAFNFKFAGKTYTACLRGEGADAVVAHIECDDTIQPTDLEVLRAEATASFIFGEVRSMLHLSTFKSAASTPVLSAIALAYEAQCEAHDAQCRALRALPRYLQNPSMVPTHPSELDRYAGGAVGMLAQYVDYVVEQACKAQTERAEQAAKVAP